MCGSKFFTRLTLMLKRNPFQNVIDNTKEMTAIYDSENWYENHTNISPDLTI